MNYLTKKQKVFIISLMLTFYCCEISKKMINSDILSDIKRLKSNTNTTLTLQAYDFNYKEKIGGYVEINNVYMDFKYENNDFSPIVLSVKPNSEFDVSFHFVGSKTTTIKKVKISKKDSIIIKAYLKSDDIID